MSNLSRASRLLLYKRDASPPSCAVMMLGNILDLKFQYKEPDLIGREHLTPEFKKLNPMATVPVLVDDDFVVSESHAIMKYLLSKYSDKHHQEALYPSDLRKRAIVDQCLFFDTGVLFVALKSIALPIFLEGSTGPTPRCLENMEKAYAVLELFLQRDKYIATDHLTLADLSAGSTATAGHAMYKFDPVKYPRCNEWLEMLSEKPYFKEIMLPSSILLAKILHVLKKNNIEALSNKS